MLGQLSGVTIVTPDLDRSVAAYGEFLGYRGKTGTVPDDLARRWQTPGIAGARMAMLHPEGGEQSFIRLIACAVPDGYRPLATFGWNAAEIVVRDLDAVAARLSDSPFEIIGPPRTLDFDFTDKIRAMQVVGPGREVLYLTEVDGEIPGFDLPAPTGAVGQVFVAVLGGPSLGALADFFRERFGLEAMPAFETRIEVLSQAHGLPDATRHPLTTVALPAKTLLELDAFPEGTQERPICDCGLPAGIAVATFGGGGGELVRGPAGAWLEVGVQQI